MWFQSLTGFEEISAEYVRENLIVEDKKFVSKRDGRKLHFGELLIPTLQELRDRSVNQDKTDKIRVSELVANVQELHKNPENNGAIFQAASQFNLLEMIGPHITPERGIDIYENDFTQGPACAIACGAGTIFRNYFVEINGKKGQTESNQIDCLDLIAQELEEKDHDLWEMKNGYAIISESVLLAINGYISKLSNSEREQLKGLLKVGIQKNTAVTIAQHEQYVSQVYCSALPVAYSHVDTKYWESFARLILEATYEATLFAALENYHETGNNKVFLTLVGGGAFGNRKSWILESIEKVFTQFANTPLEIKIVSYGSSDNQIQDLTSRF